jgi:hypothetical protein
VTADSLPSGLIPEHAEWIATNKSGIGAGIAALSSANPQFNGASGILLPLPGAGKNGLNDYPGFVVYLLPGTRPSETKQGRTREKKVHVPPGQNGLGYIRYDPRNPNNLFVEGFWQSLFAASWAPLGWNVIFVNGCQGIHRKGLDLSAFSGTNCVILFDGDAITNPGVRAGLTNAIDNLNTAGGRVRVAMLPAELMRQPNDGIDDVLSDPARIDPLARTAFVAQLCDSAVSPSFLPDLPETDGSEVVGDDGRINVSSTAVVTKWLTNEIGRGKLAGIFLREDMIVHTPRISEEGYVPPAPGDDDGPAQVRPLSVDELRARLQLRYNIGRNRMKGEEGNSRKEWESAMFPTAAAKVVHDAAKSGENVPNLRRLKLVTHTPMLRRDGTVLDLPGYDLASRTLYLPDAGLGDFRIPENPTPEQIAAAVELIRTPILEFPFLNADYEASYLGAMFTPLLRPLLPPPYPMLIIDATQPGTGKSFLAMGLRIIHGGVIRAEIPRDKNELEKQLIATLATTTAPTVTFDNVRGTVRASYLEGLLTSATVTGRWLGETKQITVVNDRLWIMTSNNAAVAGDLARRTLWVRLEWRAPRPHERTGFQLHPPTWFRQNRAAYVAALLTVARGWVLAGRPQLPSERSDDYAEWTSNLRGLLAWAGFPGSFGASTKSVQGEDDTDWEQFLTAAQASFGPQWWTVAELCHRLADVNPSGGGWADPNQIDAAAMPAELAEKWSRTSGGAGFRRTLAAWLTHRVGRFAGDLALEDSPDPIAKRYRVIRHGVD